MRPVKNAHAVALGRLGAQKKGQDVPEPSPESSPYYDPPGPALTPEELEQVRRRPSARVRAAPPRPRVSRRGSLKRPSAQPAPVAIGSREWEDFCQEVYASIKGPVERACGPWTTAWRVPRGTARAEREALITAARAWLISRVAATLTTALALSKFAKDALRGVEQREERLRVQRLPRHKPGSRAAPPKRGRAASALRVKTHRAPQRGDALGAAFTAWEQRDLASWRRLAYERWHQQYHVEFATARGRPTDPGLDHFGTSMKALAADRRGPQGTQRRGPFPWAKVAMAVLNGVPKARELRVVLPRTHARRALIRRCRPRG